MLTKDDIVLDMTCSACPEQYIAYDNKDNKIAYLRLRHGYFRVDCPFNGDTVYEAKTIGFGMFDFTEREFHLDKAKQAIIDFYNKKINN